MQFGAILFFLEFASYLSGIVAWNLVKKLLVLPKNDSQQCEKHCLRDKKCASYKLQLPVYPENNRYGTLVDCFLFSSSMVNISMKVNDKWPAIASYTGYKLVVNESRNVYHTQSLILNTIATDSTSVISFPQHFFRGCSYTISLWVWMWRSKKQSYQESSIFTTRSVYPPLDELSSLFPTVLTNVGLHRNRFFFSIVKDHEGFYSGFSPKGSEVKYHEWTHIAMVIKDNLVEIYINGEYIDYVIAFSSTVTQSCPYSTILVNNVSDKRQPDQFSENVNNTILQVMGARGLRSTVGMVQQFMVVRGRAFSGAEISALFLNRPVQRSLTFSRLMRVYGVVSLDGLCFWPNIDTVLENYYLSLEWGLCPTSVCGLTCIDPAISFQGPRDPLSAMARDIILNNRTNTSSQYSLAPGKSSPGNNVGNQTDHSLHLMTTLPSSKSHHSSASLSLPASAFQPTNPGSLPAIGYTPLMAGKRKKDNTSQLLAANASGYSVIMTSALKRVLRFLLGGNAATNPAAQGELRDTVDATLLGDPDSSTGGDSEIDSGSSLEYDYYDEYGNGPYDDYDNVYAEDLQYGYDEYGYEVDRQEDSRINDTQQFSAGTDSDKRELNSSARATRYANWMRRQQSEGELFFLRDQEGRIQSLYRMAMEWLSGRKSATVNGRDSEINLEGNSCFYTNYCYGNRSVCEDIQHFCQNSDKGGTLQEWTLSVSEKAKAALWLALFFADDIAGDSPGDGANDEPWAFRYPSMLGQPIHAALAVLSGPGGYEDISTPSSLAVNRTLLSEAMGGFDLENLIGKQMNDTVSYNEQSCLNSQIVNVSDNESALKSSLDDVDWLNILSAVDPTMAQWEEAQSNPDYLPQLQPLIRAANLSSQDIASLAKNHNIQSEKYLDSDAGSSGNGSLTAPGRLSYVDCMAAAAHYFPLTQYVVSHFGSVDTGVGYLEEVRLLDMHMYTLSSSLFSSSSVLLNQGYGGEEDLLHQHTEAEAMIGDPAAQTWLGKRYFWGLGGLQPDEEQARHWFERAAQQGDAEALYNIGVFHELGQGGFKPDKKIALEYYKRAANATVPFHMALHAMGNHFLYHPTEWNHSLAREYYLKAAEKDSPEALFSLAMMHKEGIGGPASIPRTVFYLTLAANKGHLRSLNFLAHGLFDVDSWWHTFDREFKDLKRSKELMKSVGNNSAASAFPFEIEVLLEMDEHSSTAGTGKAGNSSESFNASAGKEKPLPIWLRYDAKKKLRVLLPDESITLPFPISSPENSCSAALPMLKYIADMFYRTKDLTRAALAAYIKQDLWLAVDLFDEAANLGIHSAQENAAYLYDQLMRVECPAYSLDAQGSGRGSGRGSASESWLSRMFHGVRDLYSSFRPQPSSSAGQKLRRLECELFFTKLATRRWIQLANAGELIAPRKVAEAITNQPILLEQAFPDEMHAVVRSLKKRWKNIVPFRDGFERKRKHLDEEKTHSNVSKGVDHNKKMEMQMAAQLFAAAASHGDIQSMMGLGWILFAGEEMTGMPRNLSAASHLFSWAMEYELLWESDFTHGTTYGLAPAIALLSAQIVTLYSYLHSLLDSIAELFFYTFNDFYWLGLAAIFALFCIAVFSQIL